MPIVYLHIPVLDGFDADPHAGIPWGNSALAVEWRLEFWESCDERDRTAQKFSRYPCLIVEVVSPGTEAYDRGGKFTLYRRLESLKEYVLVGSEAKTVEVFRRNSDRSWTFIPYGLGETIELASLGIRVPMEAIYEDVVSEQIIRNSSS